MNSRHFGQGFDEAVGLLQQLGRLAGGQTGQGGGHVKQIPLIQRRHEFPADAQHRPGGGRQQQHGDGNRRARPAQHNVQHRSVNGDQPSVQRIFLLVRNAPANQIPHQHRDQRDGQPRCRRHGIGFGEGQRRKQTALLRFKGEHRNKGQRDDEQAEKQRRAHLGSRIADDAPAGFAFQRACGVFVRPALQVFVRVFNHHHRRIHHRANGDRDAAQRHDVGVHALVMHHDEGRQNAQRQRHNRDQR